MKKLFFLAMLLAYPTLSFSQQKGTSDLSFGVGFVETSNEFLNSVEDIIDDVSYANTSVSPAYNLTYKYAIRDRWFLYADAAFQTIKEDVRENNLTIGDVSTRYFTVGFGSNYHYISREWFQMYSGASIAYTSQYSDFTTSSNIDNESDGYFNYQVNALGFRFGKSLAAFLELGIGYKGVVNAGVSYQF